MGSIGDFISSIMSSGKGAAGIFGKVKDSGDDLADGFFGLWKK